VNLPSNDTTKTIELKTKINILAILCIFANLKSMINVTEMNIAITVPTPVLTPAISRINENISSVVTGKVKLDAKNLTGSANLSMLNIALKEKSISNTDETNCACFFMLGNLLRMPLPIIVPCSKPIPSTTANVIKKFSAAKSSISKSYSHSMKLEYDYNVTID